MDDPDQLHLDVLTTASRPATAPLLAAVLLLAATGCGSFAPPAPFRAQADVPTSSEKTGALGVRPVEGRPDGLVLALHFDVDLDPGSRLVVERRVGSDEPERLRTIELDGDRARRASEEGIEFIDRSVQPDSTIHYRVAYYRPGRSPGPDTSPDRRSPVRTVEWSSPPSRPEEVTARADTHRAVELRWEPGGTGALIFRRDVLDRSAGAQRIAVLEAGERGVHLDRDIAPGGVYAYRVALAVEHDSYTQYGPPSEPLYVSLPEPRGAAGPEPCARAAIALTTCALEPSQISPQ